MAESAVQAPRTGTHPVRRLLGVVLGPLWVTTFRDPVREGRYRLKGLNGAERLAARVAVVGLLVLLGSSLFATAWRRGTLLPVDATVSRQFVPAGVLGITLVGLLVAWLAITWGGLRGSAPVRVLVGALYLLINADFAVDLAVDLGSGSWILQHGRLVQQVGYFAPVGALAAAALTTRWPRLDRWVVRLARLVCLVGVGCLFLGMLWTHVALLDQGQDSFTPSIVGGSLFGVGLILLPLVYISSVAVIDFAFDVSSSLATPAGTLRRGWLLAAVLLLVAAKLWFGVAARLDYWRATLAHQPQAVVRTTICVLLLALLTWVVARFRRSEVSLAAKEDLTFASSLVLSSPFVLQILAVSAGIVVASQTGSASMTQRAADFPASWLNSWGMFIISALAMVAGAVLMKRSEGGVGDEIGSGLVLVGAWGTVAGAVNNFGFTFGFSYPSVDVVVTLLVLLVVLARWRRADVHLLTTAATVLVFTWLVTSRGDYISFAGGLVGLSGVVVVVFGIVWTLLSGSSFTSSSSRWLPQPARPLLFIGYVLLSVVILCWNETTHTATSDSDALVAYYFLGIPLAAWLLGRRVITRPEPED